MSLRDVRRANLIALLAEMPAAELSRRSGIAPSSLTRYKTSPIDDPVGGRNMGEDVARRLERAARKPPGWLDLPRQAVTTAHGVSVAHQATHVADTLLPPVWLEENVLTALGSGPETAFRLRVNDDSCGAEYPQGSYIIWSTTRTPRVGRVVLVADRHDQLHVRRMLQGRQPGEWMAGALNPAYATLHSADDALRIIATFDGYQLPPD